jgi:predicted transcriptional regulator YdeE
MTVLNENENSLIEYDLTFLKPWKSKAKVAFKLIEKEDGVMVHWLMDSSLPWFMFWMKKMMQVFVGMDYSRGLNMLKEYAEDDKVHSELTFKGAVTHKGGTYISITTECALDAIGNKMEEDYTKLMEYMMTSHKDKVGGYAFSIYHKWNPVKNYTKYTACIPVNEVPKDLPSGVEVGELKDFRADVVHHKGPYTNVGNAWSAQYTRARAKVFKQNKRKDPLEVYLNSPKDTAPNELESEIVFPIV